MIGKPIDQIREEDLQALVDSKVIELKTMEYKRSLPGNRDSDKKEFLADISSFANTVGGDLIFGITQNADTGVPESLDGLTIDNVDQGIQRLENIIRDGIEPRILSVITRPIPLSNSNVALLIRIPRSYISPHRVTFSGSDKFYGRSSNGKYPLDVGELRASFSFSETVTERIKNLRTDRIFKISANETPVPLLDNAKIVLHLVPLISFTPAQIYDLSAVSSDPSKMPPIRSTASYWRYNLDGFLTYSGDQQGVSRSYTQLFRNGIIEAVESYMLRPRVDRPIIPSIAFEESLIRALTDYLSVLNILNVEPPVFVFLTLIGVKGFSMGIDTWRYDIDELYTIDRDILSLPEIVVQGYQESADEALKPCFDSIWNACGFRGDFYYDNDGNWNPNR